MSEYRSVLERAGSHFPPLDLEHESIVRRRDRKRRDQRIRAGVLGLAIAIAVGWLGVNAIRSMPPVPLDDPTPTPAPATSGSLAYALDGDIYVADWDGSNAVKIADGRPPSDCRDIGEYWWVGPIWSPDGRYLAYRHTDCDGPRDAWWDVVISDPEGNVVTSFASEGWRISWSPDSTRVAVWDRFGETIGVYGPDGERQALLTVPRGIQPGPRGADPRWSPTGELLYKNFEIPLDGSPPRMRTEGGTYSPEAYSPDGSRVAYTTNGSLHVAAAGGSDLQAIGPWVRSPVWSPTGDRIAFAWGARAAAWRGNATELRVLDVATGRVTVLVSGRVGHSAPFEFSPEGDRILFPRTEVEGAGWRANSLWSVNVDGSDLRRLVARTAMGDWLSPTQAG